MKRALISVYNKEGLADFAKGLVELGWELISTGGTARFLSDNKLEVREIKDLTNFPEILDGRVKSLHPHIHGGILYKRDDMKHIKTLEDYKIGPIDMVVNNFYPFEDVINRPGIGHDELIENIDIGGPSMVRAAAKNYKYVTVVIDPKDYNKILEELIREGETTNKLKSYLGGKAFQYTAYYDSLIGQYFNRINTVKFPDFITFPYKDRQELRYGENPHQKAAFYRRAGGIKGTIAGAKQVHGRELSFNNINDSNGALEILKEFQEATVVAVKHANPCGIGSGENLLEAYIKAYESDKVSIFGGIVAANREICGEVASMINNIFVEIVIGPSFSQEALKILSRKKKIKLLEVSDIMKDDYHDIDIKKVLGGILVQERDRKLFDGQIKVVSKSEPSQKEMDDLLFAWKAVKKVKSNGVLLAKNKATIGIGVGEVNRVWAVRAAIERAGERSKGSVLASDGFFPFKDSIEALAQVGVRAIIQPGGSIRDDESINEANKYGMAMVFTGTRHFNH